MFAAARHLSDGSKEYLSRLLRVFPILIIFFSLLLQNTQSQVPNKIGIAAATSTAPAAAAATTVANNSPRSNSSASAATTSASSVEASSNVLPPEAEIKIPAVGATPVAISTKLPAAVVQLTQQGEFAANIAYRCASLYISHCSNIFFVFLLCSFSKPKSIIYCFKKKIQAKISIKSQQTQQLLP